MRTDPDAATITDPAAAEPAPLSAPSQGNPTSALRICMVISSYFPIVGGAEKQVAQLAHLMRGRGHEVSIITRRYPGLSAREFVDGVPVRRVAQWGPKPLGSLCFVAGAVWAIREARPDVIHCHSMFSPALAGAFGRHLTGAPVLVKPMCSGEARSISEKWFGARRLAYLGREVGRIIAVSCAIEYELLDLGIPAAKIRRIPNGVDLARFHACASSAEKAAERERLGLPPDVPLFLFAGRIAAQKRLPLLLRAWPRVHAAVPEARLLIAGANRLTPTMFAADVVDHQEVPRNLLNQPGVHCLGHIDDMPAYMRAADAFVLPSSREGLSNALLEACASGLATVSANIGGAEDFILDRRNGLLFAPDDGDALTAAMIALVGDPALRSALGQEAARTVSAQYDIRNTADHLIYEYAELLGAARNPA